VSVTSGFSRFQARKKEEAHRCRRLTLDEFATRADAAHRAVTYGDPAALSVDLPDELDRRYLSRGPLAIALVVAVVLALLLGVGATAQAAGVLHMNAMMAGMGAAMPGCG
jgi:hypothetical protein